jgi:hypothetical protein
MKEIDYPKFDYNVVATNVLGNAYYDRNGPIMGSKVFVSFGRGKVLSDMDNRTRFYIIDMFEQLFADRGSPRLAFKRIDDSFPSLEWEVRNILRSEHLSQVIQDNNEYALQLGSLDHYVMEGSYGMNLFIREHTRNGIAESDSPVLLKSPYYMYRGPGFDYLNWSEGFVHPYQVIQWMIAFSSPLPSPTHVFRWGNGPERNVLQTLQVGDIFTLAGYTSTTLMPWLTFEFSNPVEVRNSPNWFGIWDGLNSIGVSHVDVNPETDLPYGMMINLPSKTRCLFVGGTPQAEIILAHSAQLKLTKKFVLDGGPDYNYRIIPFFIFDLYDDGIRIVE